MNITRSFNTILCVLQVGIGVTAVLGGFGLVSDPSGAEMEIPLTLLENSIFADYLIPGLVLLIVIGAGNVLGGIATLNRHRHFGTIAIFLGGFLVVYILIETGIVGLLNVSQPIYVILGFSEIVLGLKLPGAIKRDTKKLVESTVF